MADKQILVGYPTNTSRKLEPRPHDEYCDGLILAARASLTQWRGGQAHRRLVAHFLRTNDSDKRVDLLTKATFLSLNWCPLATDAWGRAEACPVSMYGHCARIRLSLFVARRHECPHLHRPALEEALLNECTYHHLQRELLEYGGFIIDESLLLGQQSEAPYAH